MMLPANKSVFKVSDVDICEHLKLLCNGLLSPSGEFHICGYGYHSELARTITTNQRIALLPESDSQDTLLKLKWIRLQDCRWYGGSACCSIDKENHESLTQSQRDFIFEWSEARNKAVPWKEEASVAPMVWA